jgi:hypothetical protein
VFELTADEFLDGHVLALVDRATRRECHIGRYLYGSSKRGWGIALYNRRVPPRFDSHKYIAYRLAHIVASPGATAPDSTAVTDLLCWKQSHPRPLRLLRRGRQ